MFCSLRQPIHSYCRWSGKRNAEALALAILLQCLPLLRARAEDQLAYRYESYREDHGRMDIATSSVLFEKKITSWLTVKGEGVYDAISGATPLGVPSPAALNRRGLYDNTVTGPFSSDVATQTMEDWRYAGSLEAQLSLGAHRLTPQFSYSEENDYISHGWALNYAFDFNQKNTTLNLGWAGTADRLSRGPLSHARTIEHKRSDDFIIGINQLLTPKTVLTLNFTYGKADGYLADPYKKVFFENFNGGPNTQFDPDPDSISGFPEKRPHSRERYIGFASLTQYISPLDASIEGSYRYFYDTYHIGAHTIDLAWHQKLGRYITLTPLFRYYHQSQAYFYAPTFPDFDTPPTYYSADHRLSRMETFTYGASLDLHPAEWLTIDFAFKRYAMHGLDHLTDGSMYPQANIVTAGFRLWF